MIILWYEHHGQRPSKSEVIQKDANKASTLPASFAVIRVQYGRQTDDGVDSNQFALWVDPPSDNLPEDAINSIATAFKDNWGGTIDFVDSIVQS